MMITDFSLPDQNGEIHNLSDYKGQWVLIYFYPKDNTPGCTIEACSIRDNFNTFEKLKVKVIGISCDPVKKHKKFADKYKLPFTLLSDEEREVVKLFNVWQEKKFMGHKYMGIMRESFLINPQGEIVKHYKNVKPIKHSKQILNDLKELM